MLKKIEAAVSFSLKIGSHYLVFCLWLHVYSTERDLREKERSDSGVPRKHIF
jgi:hypothetical protein